MHPHLLSSRVFVTTLAAKTPRTGTYRELRTHLKVALGVEDGNVSHDAVMKWFGFWWNQWFSVLKWLPRNVWCYLVVLKWFLCDGFDSMNPWKSLKIHEMFHQGVLLFRICFGTSRFWLWNPSWSPVSIAISNDKGVNPGFNHFFWKLGQITNCDLSPINSLVKPIASGFALEASHCCLSIHLAPADFLIGRQVCWRPKAKPVAPPCCRPASIVWWAAPPRVAGPKLLLGDLSTPLKRWRYTV